MLVFVTLIDIKVKSDKKLILRIEKNFKLFINLHTTLFDHATHINAMAKNNVSASKHRLTQLKQKSTKQQTSYRSPP